MGRSSFWSEPCPKRGTGLTHMHAPGCVDDSHAPSTCCHCGKDELDWRGERLPPVDIAARRASTRPKRKFARAELTELEKQRLDFYVNHLRSAAVAEARACAE